MTPLPAAPAKVAAVSLPTPKGVAGVLEVLVAAQPGAAAPEEAGECLATEAI